jgi:hypothetical protein
MDSVTRPAHAPVGGALHARPRTGPHAALSIDHFRIIFRIGHFHRASYARVYGMARMPLRLLPARLEP